MPGDPLEYAPILSGLPTEQRRLLAADAPRIQLSAGEWLFRQGDPARSAYVVRSGRLEVVGDESPPVVIRELKRGAVVGELALLHGGQRSASARAARESELLEVRRERFEALLADAPGFALALTRSLAEQLAAVRTPAGSSAPPVTIAVVALDRSAPAAAVADRLEHGLRRFGSLARLDGPPEDLPAVLARAEREHDRVLLVAHAAHDGWGTACRAEADRVVAVAAAPTPDPAIRLDELFVLGEAPAPPPPAVRNLHVRRDLDGLLVAVDVLARRLAGRSLGLVLSGGGARAFAHLGVLEVLLGAGLAIDRLAGVSMGAVVAGSVAAGFEPSALYARFEEHFLHANPSNDYTIPAIALLRGRKARRILADVLGSRRIEELPRSFFCLSCDLVARRPVVHRTGPLTDAVYASLAIPGIFPPMLPDEARVLVDGGILDNLPVETMDAAREGPVIASDVTDPDGRWASARRRPPGRIGRLLVGTDEPLPSLGETLFRTFTLGSIDTAEAAHRHADLVIVPPVAGIPLMDWKRLARLRDLGRRAAETALARHDELLRSWM